MGTRGVNPVSTSPGSSYIVNVDPVPGATLYQWFLPSGFSVPNNGPTTTVGPSIYVTTSLATGSYSISCQAQNNCGGAFTRNLIVNNGTPGGGGNNCPPGFTPPCRPGGPAPLRVSPNPTSNQIVVSFEVPSEDDQMQTPTTDEFAVTLHHSFGKLVREGKSQNGELTIDVLDLPKGLYVLRVTRHGEKVITRQVFIEH
jgi:hypothetical protein